VIDSPSRPPLDFIAHRGEGTIIGAFRCARDDPRFRDSGPIQNDILVFPRTSVRIRHAGGASFIADHSVATVYNRGQLYDRGPISEEGDRCDWFAVPRSAASEALAFHGVEPGGSGPFSFPFVRIEHRTYLAQRRLFSRARAGAPEAEIDEGVFALLDEVAEAASRRKRERARDPRGVDLSEGIRTLLAGRFEEEWPLSRLSSCFGVSPFRLCRAFKKATGSTIHQYLLTLRLRAALEHLERPGTDLSALANDLGFSGHSHFSLAFRQAFGETPSRCRATVAPSSRRVMGARGH